MAGLFISMEGGDGSGKSTQARALQAWLEGLDYEVVMTREPGGTELGKHIRELLLHGADVAPRAEALLFAADRAHHVATKIRPALDRGAVVITDRYLDSSVAYQGASRNLGAEEIRELSLWAVDGLLPDVTLLVDVPAEIGAKRVGKNQDRLESAGLAFHQQVRDGFLALAAAEPERYIVVDGTASIEEITAQLKAVIEPRLKAIS